MIRRQPESTPFPYKQCCRSFEFRNQLGRTGARRYRIVLPRISAQELPRFSGWERRGVDLYHALLNLAPARYVFYVFGPFFHVLVRNAERGPGTRLRVESAEQGPSGIWAATDDAS